MSLKKSSNKSFGILFFIVFLLISLWPLLSGGNFRIWSLIISLIFLVLGLLKSKLLTPLNYGWIKLGEILGKIIAPVVMFLIFFTILTPIGLILKLFGKDLLNSKFSKVNSYWIKRKKDIGSMKKQF
tara:strand:+ start:553 stop:933 length:381 start_codon:yes stop_codon:yes gene_type:complete